MQTEVVHQEIRRLEQRLELYRRLYRVAVDLLKANRRRAVTTKPAASRSHSTD